MNKSLARVLFAISLLIVANVGCTESTKEEVGGIDILVLTLIKDVQDHTLYIQLTDTKNPNLINLLSNNLSMKLFDLNQHLAATSNKDLVKLACDAAIGLRDDINEITNDCQNSNSSQICEEFRTLNSFCK